MTPAWVDNAVVLAEDDLRVAAEACPTWGLLSILEPGRSLLPHPCDTRLDLRFDDTPRWTVHFHPPRREHAALIVAFAKALDAPGLIVHCAAGISRSAAALCGALAAVGADPVAQLPVAVGRALGRGWRDDGIVYPNPRLLGFLDLELGAGGSFLRACLPDGPWTFESVQIDCREYP